MPKTATLDIKNVRQKLRYKKQGDKVTLYYKTVEDKPKNNEEKDNGYTS